MNKNLKLNISLPTILCLTFVINISFANNVIDELNQDSHYVIITNISITGNKTTKESVIYREINFSVGDTIQTKNLEEIITKSKNQLINTALFNHVEIEYRYWEHDKITVYITLNERWYVWPVPVFQLADRNFNEWWVSQDRDISRINAGLFFVRNNVRGRNETFRVLMQFGYTEKLGIRYSIPYLSKKQKDGVEVFISYYRNHEVAYKTYENKLLFYTDYKKYISKIFYAGINYIVWNATHNKLSIELKYNNNIVDADVTNKNQEYFSDSSTSQQYFTATYNYVRDYRDIKAYPLTGNYTKLELSKKGIGIFQDVDLWEVIATHKMYWKIVNRNYLSMSIKAKFSGNQKPGYFHLKALGYGDFVRGYEYYVIDGHQFVLLKTNYKFEILPTQIQKIKELPVKQFSIIPVTIYANLYTDIGYTQDNYYSQSNDLSNQVIVGFGAGIDFVTFYDKIIRFEYSITKDGEKGLFLHFTVPI